MELFMTFPDEALSLATDARTNAHIAPATLCVSNREDMTRLRALWSKIPAIPKLVPSRNLGADHSWPGFDVRTLLHGEESSGRFSFHSIVLAPNATLPAHSHAVGDTYWFVLKGQVEVTIGSATRTLVPRAFAFAPELTTQAIVNRSAAPAEVIVGYSPAGADRAFAAAHRLWQEQPAATAQAYLSELERHGFMFTDGKPQPNDAKVNTESPRLDSNIERLDDLLDLRRRWGALSPTPKVVEDPHTCFNIPIPDQETRVMLTPEESRSAATVFLGGLAKGYGAPPHHQPTEEEVFIVLDGSMELTIGNQTAETSSGAFGFAPRFGTHAFMNKTDRRVLLVTMNSPGGHDRGFEMATREFGSPRFPELITAHGFQFHGPGPT
jgi:quercetin dioxygenase-like cupin family protein